MSDNEESLDCSGLDVSELCEQSNQPCGTYLKQLVTNAVQGDRDSMDLITQFCELYQERHPQMGRSTCKACILKAYSTKD